MSTLPSLLTAVETLIHTAMPWHCPWMKRRLRDFIVAILVGQTVVIRSLAATLIWTIVTDAASTFSAPVLSEDSAGQRLGILWGAQAMGRATLAGTVVQVSTGLTDTSNLTFDPKDLITGKSQIGSYTLGDTFLGDQALLAWIDHRGTLEPTIQFRRVDHDGVPLTTPQTLPGTAKPLEVAVVPLSPSLGWMLGWVEEGKGGTADIYVMRISPTGTAETATKTLVTSIVLPNLVSDLKLTVNTTTSEVLASWYVYQSRLIPHARAQRLATNGSLVGSSWNIASQSNIWATTYHSGRNEYFVVWSQGGTSTAALYGQRYSATGTALTSATLITALDAPAYDLVLRALPDVDRYIVAHDDYLTAPGRIMVSTISGSGTTLIDTTVVSVAARTFDGFDLVVADTIEEYMLLWVSDPPAIRMQRWTQTGQARGGHLIPFTELSDPHHEPSALFHDTHETFLVTTNTTAASSSDSQIFGKQYVPLRASFIQAPITLDTIVFTDTSTPVTDTTRLWEFGDGTTATTQVVTHTYTTHGTYPLTLTVTNGSETLVVTDLITIIEPLVADFDTTINHSTGTVTFTDTSTPAQGITTWQWNLGDGSPITSIQNLVYTYAPGSYTVTLTVNTALQTATATQVITIAEPLIADFEVAIDHSTGTATFTDTSTPAPDITGWQWDFGDSSPITSTQNLVYTYAPGSYTVTLTASTALQTATTTQIITIAEPLVADFEVVIQHASGTTTFTDTSTPASDITAWQWGLGDGSPITTTQNLVYTYAPGSYTVTLTVSTTLQTATTTQVITIADTLIAGFDVTIDHSTGTATFTDTSIPFEDITTWQWDLGDGSPITSTQNLVYTYAPGSYTVTLTASTALQTATATQVITITEPLIADFDVTIDHTSGTGIFTDTSTPAPDITAWQWNLGDGSPLATTQHVTHTYQPGTYTVTLTMNTALQTATTTQVITIAEPLVADFAVAINHSTGTATFTDISTPANDITEWLWDLGNGFGSYSQHVTRTYQPSSYTVTLTVSTALQTATTTQVITIAEPLVADFDGVIDHASGTTTFTDTSTSVHTITAWQWDFGDGSPLATTQHVTHTYQPGTYTVTLTVTAGSETRSTTHVLTILEPPVIGTCPDGALEPNNHLQTATPTRPFKPMHGVLCDATDRDWYSFDAVAGTAYTLKTSALGIDIDTLVTVYDAAGTVIETTDTDSSATTSISFQPLTTGRYYVELANWNPAWNHMGGVYTFEITTSSCVDSVPVHNDWTTAVSITEDMTWFDAVCTNSDQDYYAFTAQPGGIYQVIASGLDAETSGTFTTYSMTTPTTPTDWAPPITYEQDRAITYLYGVGTEPSAWLIEFETNRNNPLPDRWYDLEVREVTCPDAMLEPNNDRTSAITLSVNIPQHAAGCHYEDVDWYTVYLEAGTTYRVRIMSEDRAAYDFSYLTSIALYNSSVPHFANQFANYTRFLTYTPTQDEWVHIKVGIARHDPTVEYTIDVVEAPTCTDYTDTPQGPLTPTLQLDTWTPQIFCSGTDKLDAYTFTVTETATYNLELTPAYFDTYIQIVETTSGSPVHKHYSTDSQDITSLAITANLTPGTYEARVHTRATQPAIFAGDPQYESVLCLSLTSCLDPAEPNNSVETAAALSVSTPYTGSLKNDDIDVFKLELQGGTRYAIQLGGDRDLSSDLQMAPYGTSIPIRFDAPSGNSSFLAPKTTDYYLTILRGEGVTNHTYTYHLQITPLDTASLIHDDSHQSWDTAQLLTIGTPSEERLAVPNNPTGIHGADFIADWFRVEIVQDRFYVIQLDEFGRNLPSLDVTIYNDYRETLTRDTNLTLDLQTPQRDTTPVYLKRGTYTISVIPTSAAFIWLDSRYTIQIVPVERPIEDRIHNPWVYVDGDHPELERYYMDEINAFREEFGLFPLAHNPRLTHASRRFSDDWQDVDPENNPHIGSDGSTPQERADDAGYTELVAENAAYCYDTYNPELCLDSSYTPYNPVEGWKTSRGHRQNMLNPTHREMGLGISEDGNGTTFLGGYFTSPHIWIALNNLAPSTSDQIVTVTLDTDFVKEGVHEYDLTWEYAISHDPDFSDATWTPLTATTRVFTDTYTIDQTTYTDVYSHTIPVDVAWELLPGTGLKTVFVAYRNPDDPYDRPFVGNATIWLSTLAVTSTSMPPLPPLPQHFQTDTFVGAGTTKIALHSGTGFLPPALGIRISSFMADQGTNHQGSSVGHGASLSSYAVLRVPDATPATIADDQFMVEWDGMLYPLVQDRQQPSIYYLAREESAGNGLAGIRPVFQKVMSGTHGIDGGEAWVMTDTAGLRWTFGTTLNSAWRYRDAADAAHIWRWNLAEVEDRQTNVQTWTYTPDTSTINGVDYEQGGVVSSIQCGGNRTLGTAAHRNVTFAYENRFPSGSVLDHVATEPFYLTQRLASVTVNANNAVLHHYELTYLEQADGTRTRLLLDTITRLMSDGTTEHTAFNLDYSAPDTIGEGYRLASVDINDIRRDTLTYERRTAGTDVTYPVRSQTIETDGGSPTTMTFTYGSVILDPAQTSFWGYELSKSTASAQVAARSETPPPGDSSEQYASAEPPTQGKPFKDTCEDEEEATGSRSLTTTSASASTICHKVVTNYDAAQFVNGQVRLEYPNHFTDIRQADGSYETHQINTTYSADGYPVYVDQYGDSDTPEDDVFIEYTYHPTFSDLVIDERIVDRTGTLLARTTTAYHPGTRLVAERGRWLLEENRVLTTTMAYDVRGQRTVMTNTLGYPTVYAYNADGNQTTITNSLGYATTSTYDTLGRIISVTDARGASTTYAYDPATGLPITTTNALGAITISGYDDQRRKVRETTPDGATTWFGSTDLGNLAVITNALGYTTTFGYDSRGHQIWTQDALGHRNIKQYDGAQGLLVATTDALGHTSSYAYDGAGRTVATYDPRGATNHTAYDGHGRVVTTTNALGFTDITAYDVQGRVISTTNALGDTTMYGYDSLSRQTVVTDALGYVTQTIYDDLDRPIQVIDPRGAVTHTAYDALGRVISTTNALSHTTLYAYDVVGNQTIITDTLGYATVNIYDLLGRRTRTTNALGYTTSYGYDVMGRQTIITDTRGYTTTYGYDLLGRQTAMTDALGLTSLSGYDALGRNIIMTDTEGYTTTYGYDALGRQTAMTDTLGGVTRMAYNASGHTTMTTDTLGITTTYQTDLLGQVLTTTMPLSTQTHMTYDALGRLIAQTDPLGVVTSFTYDAKGRLTHVVENALPGAAATVTQNVTTTFVYDPGDNLLHQIDANGHAITHTYDLLGQRTTTTDPLGKVTTLTYTPRGELATSVDAIGQTTVYTYDAIGRLEVINYPPGTPDVSYAYDEASNVITMTDGLGTTTYTYDLLNRMATRTRDGATVTYTSTARGQVTGIDYWNTGAITMTHDGLARIDTLTLWNGETSSYGYHGSTNSTRAITRSTGLVSTFGYDSLGRLNTAFHAHQSLPLFQHAITYDLRGDQRTQTEWLAGSGPLTTHTHQPRVKKYLLNALS